MKIVELRTGKSEVCRDLLEALPQWFGLKDAREVYINNADHQVMLACLKENKAVGMLCLQHHSKWNIEITVMGVLPAAHRNGIGTALIDVAIEHARKADAKLLSVKTISSKSPDPHYKNTRAFYCSTGFELFEELPTFWDEHNPCAIYVRPI